MFKIKQITPDKLLANKTYLESFLNEELVDSITENSWIEEWEKLAQRFQLFKFEELPKSEIAKLQWDTNHIQSVVEETIHHVNRYLTFNELHVTILPALPFPFHHEHPEPLWTNAFTNGPDHILIAIPPQPDIDFFQYLLAHELHHASPENPIYNLSLSTFTLEEWYKMEGTAEYFSLSLYPDKRWWKNNFPLDVEVNYWNQCREHLKSTDDNLKNQLCFGSQKRGIPVFAGYSFALNLVSNYVFNKNININDIRELFRISPYELIECYKKSSNFN